VRDAAADARRAGRPRLLPGEGFALRRGIWAWARAVATERPSRPVGLALREGPALASRTFTHDGRALHVRAGGPAAPSRTAVVLVHGVIVSSRYLMPLGVELARDRPVLIPDLPGYGLSEPPDRPPSLASLAGAVIACARAAGHARVALIGQSFGAQVVVAAAARDARLVERLALVGPTVDPAARNLPAQYVRWQRNTPDEHLSVVPIMARDLADVGPVRAAQLLRVMLADAIEDRLPAVACPALVLRGGRDRVVPAAWAERVAGALPRGELAVLPGYAHMAHYSGPLAVAPVLRRFLDAAHPPR
jgi:2-hydroxy-6-oxonona-2,4-dienedioate hydrolase